MSLNDDQLIELINCVIEGTATKQELAMEIQEEVFGLTYSVTHDEAQAKNLTKNALSFICKNLDTFTEGQNVHRHIATLTSVYLYSKVSGGVSETGTIYEYKFDRIREDEEFLETFKSDAKAFKNPAYLKKASARFKKLTPIQIVMVQLYAYEMNSIDAIEEMLNVDSAFIGSIIAEARAVLLGIKLEGAVVNGNGEEAEESEAGAEAVKDQENRSEAESHEEKENFVTAFLLKLFPSLTLKMRKIISYCAGSVLIATIAIVVVVALAMSHKTDKKLSSESETKDISKETVAATQSDGNTSASKAPTVAPGQTVPLELAPTVPERTQATEKNESETPSETVKETSNSEEKTGSESKSGETTTPSSSEKETPKGQNPSETESVTESKSGENNSSSETESPTESKAPESGTSATETSRNSSQRAGN